MEQRPYAERCILSFGSTSGPPMLPALYNNHKRIVQSEDTVMILIEMVHDARIVRRLDENRQRYFRRTRAWRYARNVEGRTPFATLWIRPGPRKIAPSPHNTRSVLVRFGARCRGRRSTDELLPEQEICRDDRVRAAGATELCGRHDQLEQGDQNSRHTPTA